VFDIRCFIQFYPIDASARASPGWLFRKNRAFLNPSRKGFAEDRVSRIRTITDSRDLLRSDRKGNLYSEHPRRIRRRE